jgi:Protein of unknown function (DUF3108)
MRNFSAALISIALAAMALAARAAPPGHVEVAYEVSKDGTALADIVERLEHGAGRYELVETWKGRGVFALRGAIRRLSRGTVGDEGLRPVEFADERTGRETARAKFDWSAKTLTMQYKGDPQTVPLPPNAQDRLSFLIAFAFLPLGPQPISFSVADGGGVSRYVFDVVGRERVKTPAGEFDAVKLARRKDGPEDRRSTEIWLATARGQLPVRVLITEKDGSRLDQLATRISTP